MRLSGIILSLIIGSLHIGFTQGAIDGYMKGRGNTDFALTYSYEHYNKYWFGQEKQSIQNTSQSVSFFAAHGFSDSLDLVISIPFIWTDSINRNFQDGIIMARFRNRKLLFEKTALSLMTAAGLSLPLSDYPTTTERPIGARSTIIQARALAQYEWYSGYFIMLKTGYDFRLTPIQQSAVPILLKLGIAKSKIYADAWLELYQTFNAVADSRVGAGQGSSWLRLGATVYFPINKRIGAFIGGAQFLSGKNIGQASRINIGMVYKHSWNK